MKGEGYIFVSLLRHLGAQTEDGCRLLLCPSIQAGAVSRLHDATYSEARELLGSSRRYGVGKSARRTPKATGEDRKVVDKDLAVLHDPDVHNVQGDVRRWMDEAQRPLSVRCPYRAS